MKRVGGSAAIPSVRPNSTTRLVAQQPVRFSLLIGIAAFLGAFGVTRSFPGAVVVGLAAGLSLALAWIPQNGPCQVWRLYAAECG